jgi:hypothetical protein
LLNNEHNIVTLIRLVTQALDPVSGNTHRSLPLQGSLGLVDVYGPPCRVDKAIAFAGISQGSILGYSAISLTILEYVAVNLTSNANIVSGDDMLTEHTCQFHYAELISLREYHEVNVQTRCHVSIAVR